MSFQRDFHLFSQFHFTFFRFLTIVITYRFSFNHYRCSFRFICTFFSLRSLLIGNTFVYFQFQGKEHIDETTRRIVITVLISIAVVGVIFFATLRHVRHPFESDSRDRELEYKPIENSIVGAFSSAVKLFCTREMLLLSITFFYTGTYERAATMNIIDFIQLHCWVMTMRHLNRIHIYNIEISVLQALNCPFSAVCIVQVLDSH